MKTLTINELRRQPLEAPIWVMNESIHKEPKERANIVFTAKADNGDVSTVAVYVTWIPTCLTDLTDRHTLLRSQGFLNAVHGGILKIISEEEAQKVLLQKGAIEEYARVRKLNINSTVGLGETVTEAHQTQIEVIQGDNTERKNVISASVDAFCELMEQGTGIEALNSLRNLGALQEEEYAYIMRQARGFGSKYQDVCDFCLGKLNKKAG